MLRKITFTFIAFLFISHLAFAGEGMWLPMLIKKMNYQDMQKQGLKLTCEEIYDINNSSIKDAVVGLGQPQWQAQFNFCTGEIISSKGLFLTNHHCGLSAIQSLSTTEKNFVDDGYWAMSPEEEIKAGFSVSILQSMDDVTSIVLEGIDYSTSEEERGKLVHARMDSLKKAAEKNDSLITAVVKDFFNGNEYYIFHYKVFNDVRFVGAPPASIGKYGGDTDNWMWPRHTGDFSIFRIYADKNNNPADYSEDNVPYTPKHYLPISLKGVEKGDYAMIFGFPGSTDRFLTSYGVKLATDVDQPARVKIRRKKLDLYEEGMERDEATRLKYTAKRAQVSNYWKYFIGQTAGLKALKVYEKKKAQEDAFELWASKNDDMGVFANVISDYKSGYAEMSKYQLAGTYLSEAMYGVEILRYSRSFASLEKALSEEEVDNSKISSITASLSVAAKDYFKDYDAGIDQKVLAAMVELYHEDLSESQQPTYLIDLVDKSKHDFNKLAANVFKKSIFVSEERVNEFLANPSLKKLQSDPAFVLISAVRNKYNEEVVPLMTPASEKIDIAGRLYIDGLRKQHSEKIYYPDANSTMRITYGQVQDYYPKDAVYYNYITTLTGVMEKEDPSNPEFIVPERLKELYEKKDYGRYGKDGKLVVNFISSNDITGGNSGSPVINGNGELIGTAFDGNWEAMSGDIAFEPELQRTISQDIRYTLFIIDKYAGAGYLLKEMTIVE